MCWEGQTEKCRSDWEVGVSLYVACMLVETAMQCNGCLWELSLVGWSTVGRMDRSMVGGWIYSKPVGWLVCLFADRSIGSMDGQWLARWSVRSLFGRLVTQSGRLAISNNHCLNGHPYFLYSTDDQQTKDSSFIIISDNCLNFRYRGPMSPRFRPAGWLWWGCLTHTSKSLVKCGECFIESLWGIYSSLSWRTLPDRSGNIFQKCMICFAMPCISTCIFMLYRDRYLVTAPAWAQPTLFESKSWIKAWFGEQITNLSVSVWFQTFYLVWAKL